MALVFQPKSVRRATSWDTAVEEGSASRLVLLFRALLCWDMHISAHTAYRFQIAGYRDQNEYSTTYPAEAVGYIECVLDSDVTLVLLPVLN